MFAEWKELEEELDSIGQVRLTLLCINRDQRK